MKHAEIEIDEGRATAQFQSSTCLNELFSLSSRRLISHFMLAVCRLNIYLVNFFSFYLFFFGLCIFSLLFCGASEPGDSAANFFSFIEILIPYLAFSSSSNFAFIVEATNEKKTKHKRECFFFAAFV
jgi:hypothetical protein